MSLLDRRPRRERATDQYVHLPGARFEIFRRRADGLVRIEVENYGDGTMVELYLTDDERKKVADAFASMPSGANSGARS